MAAAQASSGSPWLHLIGPWNYFKHCVPQSIWINISSYLNNENIRNYKIQTRYNVRGGSTTWSMHLKLQKIYALIGGYSTSPSAPDYLFYLTAPCIYTVVTITQHCVVKCFAHDVASSLLPFCQLSAQTDSCLTGTHVMSWSTLLQQPCQSGTAE